MENRGRAPFPLVLRMSGQGVFCDQVQARVPPAFVRLSCDCQYGLLRCVPAYALSCSCEDARSRHTPARSFACSQLLRRLPPVGTMTVDEVEKAMIPAARLSPELAMV